MTKLTDPIFNNEEAARAHFEAIRWPDGRVCPHCGTERIAVKFWPRLSLTPGGYWNEAPDEDAKLVWNRTGETFEDISLTPSVNATGHWHGNITNGEAVPA